MDEYASHLPVLNTILATIRPRDVLEFGGGKYSTPAILGAPSVQRLVTVEADPAWRRTLADEFPDPRLTVVADCQTPPGSYDLVLIDDAVYIEDRVATIHLVLGAEHPPEFVMVHDSDVPEYRAAIEAYPYKAAYIPTEPETAVLWI